MFDFIKIRAIVVCICLYTYSLPCFSQYSNWKIQPINIQTQWADSVNPADVLSEYPRPQMRRSNWQSLNGLWDYSITSKDTVKPSNMEGKILVPFPIESALSGVKKPLYPNQRLWYKKIVAKPSFKKDERVILHFGAVDQEATVYINDIKIGEHRGGFDPFSFDITDALKEKNNELIVSVWDPTNAGDAPHGKQALNPQWTRYTAVSGIWQTVWTEIVPKTFIESLILTPNIDSGYLSLQVNTNSAGEGYTIEAVTSTKESVKGQTNKPLQLKLKNSTLWSPENPWLYDLTVKLLYKGKVVDTVGSYFGMRKIAIAKDEKGIERIYLNNKVYFNLGLLDQGYWPDGLYTAPTDAALKFDIKVAKQMGFNTIRKHVKIEPARWYYHCDKIGVLVWQDMPSWRQARKMPEAEKKNFEEESEHHIKNLYNSPSIIMWCPFNEDWGSYDQQRLSQWIKTLDSTRLLNTNTGSFNEDWTGSEMTDRHMYPDPTLPPYEEGKAMVCGEFGGAYIAVPDHEWLPGKGWGHSNPPGLSFMERYRQMTQHVQILQTEGLSASIFTEPYDVEIEENGLYTYDRKVFKIPLDTIRVINSIINFRH